MIVGERQTLKLREGARAGGGDVTGLLTRYPGVCPRRKLSLAKSSPALYLVSQNTCVTPCRTRYVKAPRYAEVAGRWKRDRPGRMSSSRPRSVYKRGKYESRGIRPASREGQYKDGNGRESQESDGRREAFQVEACDSFLLSCSPDYGRYTYSRSRLLPRDRLLS